MSANSPVSVIRSIVRMIDEFRAGVQFFAAAVVFIGSIIAIPILLLTSGLGIPYMIFTVWALLFFLKIGRWRLSSTSDQEA